MLIGLLEDDLAIQEMLRLLLQSEGYNVVAYASVEDCLGALRLDSTQSAVSDLDLLMIDLHLAKSVSGLSIIERMRANQRLATLPIILMTAAAFFDKQELHHLRAKLLLKPFDIDEIIQLVKEMTCK